MASILAGWGAALVAAHYAGSFQVPYYISAVLHIPAALLVLFVVRPIIRKRILKESDTKLPTRADAPPRAAAHR